MIKAQDLTKTIVGQFLSFLTQAMYLDQRAVCNLEEFKIRTFSIEVWFQRKNARQPKYLSLSLNQLANLLIMLKLVVLYLKPLTLLM